jgi:4-amino-4-deoxy-L-arabinose transferase-like glycosyltransferase
VQAIAGALTVLVAAWLALRLFSPAAGLFAAAVAAIYPFDVYLTPLILTETVFTLLLTALALSWVQWVRPDCAGKKWRAALAGFLSGVTIMVKPSILPLVGLVAIAAALCMRPRKTAVVSAVIMLFFTGAFLVPWAARNYRLTGHPVLTTLWTGKSLYEAVGPQADGGPAMDKIKLAEPYLNEYDFNEYYLQKSREEMRSDPARMLRLAGAKFLRFWNIFPNSPQYRTGLFKAASAAFMLPLLILGVAGVFRNRGSLGILWPVLAPLVFFTLLHMVFVGSVRYRAPVMPCVMALAAGSLWPRKGKS